MNNTRKKIFITFIQYIQAIKLIKLIYLNSCLIFQLKNSFINSMIWTVAVVKMKIALKMNQLRIIINFYRFKKKDIKLNQIWAINTKKRNIINYFNLNHKVANYLPNVHIVHIISMWRHQESHDYTHRSINKLLPASKSSRTSLFHKKKIYFVMNKNIIKVYTLISNPLWIL